MSESSSKPTPADGQPVSLERLAIARLFLERSSRNGRFDETVLRELRCSVCGGCFAFRQLTAPQ